MEKQKPWQLYLIIAVLVLTLYNILPTIFFYTKPLKSPIDAPRAEQVSSSIISRVNSLEVDAKSWLASFCKLLGIKPLSIDLSPSNASLVQVSFNNEKDAALFKRFLPAAGDLIPFVPAQLELSPNSANTDSANVLVQRNIAFRLDPSEMNQIFQFVPKFAADNQISKEYRDIINDRIIQIATTIGGPSKHALEVSAVVNYDQSPEADELAVGLAKEIVDYDAVFGKNNPITKRIYSGFSQIQAKESENLPQKFLSKLEALTKKLKEQQTSLRKSQSEGIALDASQEQNLYVLNNQIQSLEGAVAILSKNLADFQKGNKPLTLEQAQTILAETQGKGLVQQLPLDGYNPFIKGLIVNWDASEVSLELYPDVQKLRFGTEKSDQQTFVRDKTNQFIINDIALLSRATDEVFQPNDESFVASLNSLGNSQSFLTMNLGFLANKRAHQVIDGLMVNWEPNNLDLVREAYPIRNYDEYKNAKVEDQKLGLVVYAPAMYSTNPPAGFRNGSIYVIAKGIEPIIQKYKESPEAPESQELSKDFNSLNTLLQQMGFIGYSGSEFDSTLR